MKNDRSTPRRRIRTPDGSHSGATKFDKWLRARMVEKAGVIVILKSPIYPPFEFRELETNTNLPDGHFRAMVVEVDRYAIALEFIDYVTDEDGATWWVQKDQIVAVSVIDE